LFSVLVVLALITIIIVWWQSRSVENLPATSSQEIKVETLDGQTIIAPMKQPEAPEPELSTETSEAATEEVPEVAQQPAAAEPAPVVQAPAPVQPQVAAPATPSLPPVAAVRTLAPEEDAAAATLGNGQLVALSFSD